MGFWSVLALVIGSQIGSGVFLLPASLAPFGHYGIYAWGVAGLGAMALAFVFAQLCSKLPQTGGPHVYVRHTMGPTLAFFTGWTYWVISWVSSTAVIVASIGYLSPFIGQQSPYVYLTCEIALLLAVTSINLKGVSTAGRAEFILTLIKFIPLLLMPIAALLYFKAENLTVSSSVSNLTLTQIIGQATLLTLWGFIGVECATTPAGAVDRPEKTIPRAVLVGTFLVALVYLLNSIGIMGLIPGEILANSKAPYVDAAQVVFGGSWHYLISIMASVVCIGTLNAWMLSSGQIALGLAQDKFMPKIFARRNQSEAPVIALITCCIGIIPLLILTTSENLSKQITMVIDISVTSFLFVYLICSIAYMRLLIQHKRLITFQMFLALISLTFCAWVLYETHLKTLLVAFLFTLSGLPLYIFRIKTIKKLT